MKSEILKIIERIKSGQTTARAEVKAAIKRAEADDNHTLLEIIREPALKRADEIDARLRAGEDVGRLAGVPFVAKDNFLTYESKTTAASRILGNFKAPLQATAIELLENEGAILVGKANLDAFAHGGSTENSAYGPTKNAVDGSRVAGGSSGGSAVAVAKNIVPFALGSDTGGSIRQPASFNGVVGYKPTYGMISRYGVVAMASSTDVVGPIARSVEDVELLCEILAGPDGRDSTVLPDYFKLDSVVKNTTKSLENQRTVEIYEKYADVYEKQVTTIYTTEKGKINMEKHSKFLQKSLKSLPKTAILFEIGSGFGRDAKYIQSLGYSIQTSDAAKSFVERLKKEGLEPKQFNLLTDNFDRQYDYILANAVLIHFTKEEVRGVIQKIYNALSTGGRFVFSVKQRANNSEDSPDDEYMKEKRYYSHWSVEEIEKILAEIGFGISTFEPIDGIRTRFLSIIAEKKPKILRIGLVCEFMGEGVDADVKARTNEFVSKLTAAGHAVSKVDLPMVKYALPIYYIVVPAEISSNLARYDGIRYGQRADAKTLAEVYGRSRDAGFVDENKRRIMIGSFVLSSGFFDAYYLQAQKARTLLIGEFNKLFEQYDFLIGPTAPTPAFKIGERTSDPLKMYLSDIMTVPASLAGLPAISIPAGASADGLPIGLQIIGPQKSDARLLNFAREIEK
ncbi:MAG: aspartyl/glutamyl-tRNA amidotransferase subunit A [Candidatus Nomurabacteria bacterium]|jgi:Asp-tRNA(Asn)/Glu-tRNA(Gln) amidotransferase A subunit family amidase|nr:aspartyl/glutamyl-tRNA amidotransferase subunit A [Candidatus Nomurabacteria bacterium]